MSSLLQHHGGRSVDGRKVELLFYLEHYVEHPLSCSHCGAEYSGGMVCSCGRAITHIFRYADPHSRDSVTEWVGDSRPDAVKAIARGNCCSVSNRWERVDSELQELTKPDGTTTRCPKLYRAYRRPKGMWGCWVVFKYNGEEHVPDLSTPIGVERLPRDAKPLTAVEARAYWFN